MFSRRKKREEKKFVKKVTLELKVINVVRRFSRLCLNLLIIILLVEFFYFLNKNVQVL